MNKDYKVILVCYAFPPVKAIGSVRNQNMADSFAEIFDDIIVFTSDPNGSDEKFEVNGLQPYDIKYLFSKKGNSGNVVAPKSRKWATKIMNTFPLNLITGEGGPIYTLRILKRLWKYRKDKVILYTSFRPIADHHIAYLFKKINKKVYWIADYRDVLFDKDDLDVYFPKIQESIYKRMTKKADMLTTVSDGLGNLFEGYNDSICVLRNGIKIKSSINLEPIDLDANKFHISYTGALYEGRRDPSSLFKAISKIIEEYPDLKDKIQLNYAGKEGVIWNKMCEKFGIAEINNNLGLVSREQAISLQKNSNVNVLLSWSSPNNKGILTGKFYEYINAGNFILCLLSGDVDLEFEEIFTENKIGLLSYNDEYQTIIDHFLPLIKSKQTYIKTNNEFISDTVKIKFSWESNFEKFKNEMLNHL